MEDRHFRHAMGNFATGITIVATELDDAIYGMTANAFISVSLDPPLILVSVDEQASMHDKLKQTGQFSVSILNKDQQDVSMHFAKQKTLESIDGLFERLAGQPVIKDSLTSMACQLKDAHPAGDHTLFIGEVLELQTGSDQPPLTYYQGKYGQL